MPPKPTGESLREDLSRVRDLIQLKENQLKEFEELVESGVSDSLIADALTGIAQTLKGVSDGAIGLLPSSNPAFKVIKNVYDFMGGVVEYDFNDNKVSGLKKIVSGIDQGTGVLSPQKFILQLGSIYEKIQKGDLTGARAEAFGALKTLGELNGVKDLPLLGEAGTVLGAGNTFAKGLATFSQDSEFRDGLRSQLMTIRGPIEQQLESLRSEEAALLRQLGTVGEGSDSGNNLGAAFSALGQIDFSHELERLRMNVERLRTHTAAAHPN